MKVMWVLLMVCVLVFAVGCDSGDACGDYESDYEALVAGAKACSSDADCQRLSVFSQMTGNQHEYVNQSLTKQDLDDLDQAWLDANCHGGTYGSGDGGDPPPEAACVAGQCSPAPDPFETCNEAEPEWNLVMIIDRPSDDGECHPQAPGADIDAVEVYRDGTLLASGQALRSRPRCALVSQGVVSR